MGSRAGVPSVSLLWDFFEPLAVELGLEGRCLWGLPALLTPCEVGA